MNIIYWFLKYWLKIRIYWSNFLNSTKYIPNAEVKERIATVQSINIFAKKLYNYFSYKIDSASVLFDSIRSPQECYQEYLDGKLIDDCDGFHAALYHAATSGNFDCYLLTRISEKISQSHTTLVVKYNNKYYLYDYNKMNICNSSANIINTADGMNNSKTRYYNFVQYNYDLGKYIEVKL